MTENKSLTTGDIAKYCGVTLRTVIRWIERGSLKAYKLPGRGNNRITPEDFVAFLTAHEMPIPAEFRQQENNRILICDDEPAFAKAINRTLARAGYATEIANDGFQAGVSLVTYRPWLMTLDLSMPNIDGFEVLRHVRGNPDLEPIKILVISGQHQSDLDKAINLGADLALAKPFVNEDLIAQIERLKLLK